MFALPVLAAVASRRPGPTRWPAGRRSRRTVRRHPSRPAAGRRRLGRAAGGGLRLAAAGGPRRPAQHRRPDSAPGYFAPLRDVPGRAAAHRPGGDAADAELLGGGPRWARCRWPGAGCGRPTSTATRCSSPPCRAAGTGVPLTEANYRAWLADNAVQFVAVPDAPLSWVGRAEAELVASGLPYLTPVWSGPHWRVWAVTDPTPLVGAPAELVRARRGLGDLPEPPRRDGGGTGPAQPLAVRLGRRHGRRRRRLDHGHRSAPRRVHDR